MFNEELLSRTQTVHIQNHQVHYTCRYVNIFCRNLTYLGMKYYCTNMFFPLYQYFLYLHCFIFSTQRYLACIEDVFQYIMKRYIRTIIIIGPKFLNLFILILDFIFTLYSPLNSVFSLNIGLILFLLLSTGICMNNLHTNDILMINIK